jgi:hypothetical protein
MATKFKVTDKVVHVVKNDVSRTLGLDPVTIIEVLPCVNAVQEYIVKGEYGNVLRVFQDDLIESVQQQEKEFVKNDSEKPAAHLLPPLALMEVAKVLAFGAKKYSPNGWRKIDNRSRYAGAIQRHLLQYQSGEDIDPESGLPHLAHLACSALFLLEAHVAGLGKDDRPHNL